jgi:hypothetical protein
MLLVFTLVRLHACEASTKLTKSAGLLYLPFAAQLSVMQFGALQGAYGLGVPGFVQRDKETFDAFIFHHC